MSLKQFFKKKSFILMLSAGLILASIITYFIHFLIFRDLHHIFIYLLGDLAFVPIEVLLVTLIIESLLSMQSRRSLMEKMNMLIGTFFSEVGNSLLKFFSKIDPNRSELNAILKIDGKWSKKQFEKVSKKVKNQDLEIKMENPREFIPLKEFLSERWRFLLTLLENPILLEKEQFTELLWAVFHFAEELSNREDLTQIPESDFRHLIGDARRVYERLVIQWLDYMTHLNIKYPYLFSLAMRLNPFNPDASVVIK
ncbi:MAG: hypothetical protein ACXQS8_09630 [Candidatus Helarchaeales archaeon]